MPLENLLTLIEKLRECIDRHGDVLRQSEALTRYALIDPLLRELGWDTEDPDVVVPEYSSGGGRVDYALFADSKPVIMVEAKKLGTSLQDARKQAVEYAMDETDIKARYFSVTDGACWAIYDTNKPANDMLAASFDVNEKSAAGACLKALALWRPSVISGQIAGGETPVIGLPEKLRDNAAPIPFPEEKTEAHQTPLEVIDINQATAKDLECLPSIGSEMARRIVAYREEHGTFKHIDDITKVRDIGTKTFDLLRDHIKISTP